MTPRIAREWWHNGGVRLWHSMFVLGLAGIVSLAFRLGEPGEPAGFELFVTVKDSQGDAIGGLTAADFRIFENGVEQRIEHLLEYGGASGRAPGKQYFVLQFSDSLDQRRLFRAKRAAQAWVRRLRPELDWVAVHRRGSLSWFRSNPQEVGGLVRYFGVDMDFRQTFRVANLLPRFLLTNVPGSREFDVEQFSSELLGSGMRGTLTRVAGLLANLPGRKVLVHFGNGTPFGESELGFARPEIGGRLLSDGGLLPVEVSMEAGHESPGRPSPWALDAGGVLLKLDEEDVRGAFIKTMEGLNHYYRLAYRPQVPPNARFRSVDILLPGHADAQLLHRRGYFATDAAAFDLTDRTILQALDKPEEFRDFPINLAVRRMESRLVGGQQSYQVLLSLPLSSIWMEEPQEPGSPFSQLVHCFVGFFGPGQKLLTTVRGEWNVKAESHQMEQLLRQRATLNETAVLDSDSRAEQVTAVVIVGANRQIATAEFKFH